ncbi:MAG: multidrug effflux MFS transporter [Alphaproteobacteria bacterium]|nr:multidrug effflux MFS transporter [Alphaproteobacteria bacterium]MCB9975389.1 multidrug effflux MFS transporter [Rhodospirillales bacterium]
MREFIFLMAFLTSLAALSVDALLPAMSQIGTDLNVVRQNDVQWIIGIFFAGMMLGYALYGQLADALGRKIALNIGIALFITGCLISWTAQSLAVLLLGRFVQGFGAAGPRITTLAVIRDKHHGREMASIMSMVMGIFIFVPVIAPALGKAIMALAHWREIFLFYIAVALAGFVWTHFRLEETLKPERRKPLDIASLIQGFGECLKTPVTLGYAIASGTVFGAIIAYLNSIQPILEDIYTVGDWFPLYFGLLAAAIGAAFFSNSMLVGRLGMRRLTTRALQAMALLALLFLPLSLSGLASLPVFLIYGGLSFFCLGLMFGNMSALALEPMGHIAGTASAFVSVLSTGLAVVAGGIIGQLYNETVLPLNLGYLALALLALGVQHLTEKTRPPETEQPQ